MSEIKVLRRICDFCGEKQDFSEPTTPREQANIASWIVLVRMFPVNGQLYPVQKHACRDSCAGNMVEEQRALRKDQANKPAPAFAGDRSMVEA